MRKGREDLLFNTCLLKCYWNRRWIVMAEKNGLYVDKRVLYLEGYCEDRIKRGDLPEYMRPDYVEPGMTGLPELKVKSMMMESSFIIALRNEKNSQR